MIDMWGERYNRDIQVHNLENLVTKIFVERKICQSLKNFGTENIPASYTATTASLCLVKGS